MSNEPASPRLGWTVVYVSDVTAAVERYSAAFGLEIAFQHPSGDYAEFATGSTALALVAISLASDSAGTDLTDRRAPTGNITLVVDDVRAAFDHAVANGAHPRVEPIVKPWGQESSYVADADGNLIEIATAVAS